MSLVILIPLPTSFDSAYNEQCWPEYAAAVERCGAEPRLVPLSASQGEVEAMARGAQGILLPGSGADVDPSRYGHSPQPETAPADPARENVDKVLLEAAERHRIPTLAVCFGLQSLNVHRGGTLVQHLQPVPVNHRAGRSVSRAHASLVEASSGLGQLLAPVDDAAPDSQSGFLRLMVNSSHHQAVGVPGDGLRVTARSAEDNVIEALEDPEHPFLIGVQWHPERTFEGSGASRALIEGLVRAAGQHA